MSAIHPDNAIDGRYCVNSQISVEFAKVIAEWCAPHPFIQGDPRYELLDRARIMLMHHAQNVPGAVDEILEVAISAGGYNLRSLMGPQ